MVDIGIQGVDCMKIDEMRNAIQSLHQLEVNETAFFPFVFSVRQILIRFLFLVPLKIKEDDPCSKRICQSCVSLLVDFIMHQRTVKDTQTKIKQLINLQEQVPFFILHFDFSFSAEQTVFAVLHIARHCAIHHATKFCIEF